MTAPNLETQRAAMSRLDFLVGKWAGEAHQLRGPGEMVALKQTEEAYYKLDGLVLVIEGTGRAEADGKLLLQALGIISFDDEKATYTMRAFNDGRFLETEIKLVDRGMTWGFSLGQYRTSSLLRIDDHGDWTEQHEITIGTDAPKKFMDLRVSRHL
jgi:hypothetical protein